MFKDRGGGCRQRGVSSREIISMRYFRATYGFRCFFAMCPPISCLVGVRSRPGFKIDPEHTGCCDQGNHRQPSRELTTATTMGRRVVKGAIGGNM